MMQDVDKQAPSSLGADVCICGAGPAGISLARRLGSKNVKTILIEGGSLVYTKQSQELYEGTSTGLPYYDLQTDRLRFFGGSSNHWTGHCGNLNSQDFREWYFHPSSGWPITKKDLDPYAAAVKNILDLGTQVEQSTTKDSRPYPTDYFDPWTLWESPPTRFGAKYLKEISISPNITCIINLNLVDIVLNDDRRAVTHVVTSTNASQRIEVRAKYFVLCLGGIENPRALLNADRQVGAGIGNSRHQVGNFFTEHLMATVGKLLLRTAVASHFVSPTIRFRKMFQTLNFGLRVYTRDGQLPKNRYAWAKESPSKGCSEPFARRLHEVIHGQELSCEDGRLWISAEQSLNPKSRIALSNERDRYGQRKVNLNWNVQDLDWHTLQSAVARYGEYLIKHNLGRVRMEPWLQERQAEKNIKGGHHHMCTTRMSASPSTGVVDANCRVFDIENLYVGGSSVFSTGGHINPTFTVVQLALRLGDHLYEELKRV